MSKVDKEFKPSVWAISKSNIIYFLMFIFLAFGINAYNNLPREDFPEIITSDVFISTINPGNTPEDIERFITVPLEEAVKDCSIVVGTSGKREVGTKTSFRHFCFPWELSERFNDSSGKVALVFGGEGTGLSTQQLHQCDFLATLPTWEGYPISNLSHSVNAFLYQIHSDRVKDSQGSDYGLPEIVPLTRELDPDLRGTLLTAVNQFTTAMPGNQERKVSLNNSLIRMIMMSSPTSDEVTRIIGGLIDATTALQKNNNDEEWLNKRRRRIE